MYKILVSFIAFFPDNYQGGSGKHFKKRVIIEVNKTECLDNLPQIIDDELTDRLRFDAHGWKDANYSINSVEILDFIGGLNE